MSVSVVCEGCGRDVKIPEGYKRRKLQCSECGVMVEVPMDLPKKQAEPRAADTPTHAETAVPTSESSSPPTVKTEKGSKRVRTCAQCGEPLRMLPGQRGRKQSCPLCGTPVSLPATQQPATALTPWLSTSSLTAIQAASTPEAADAEVEEEGSSPYAVAKTEELVCPSCRKILPPGTPVCTGCGHDLEVKRDRTLPVVVRHWQVGLPPPWRVGIFLVGQVLAVLALVMAAYHDELSTAVFSWFLFTGMLAFLLGTYDWVDLTRNHRGRVVLSKTWRFCFVPRPPVVFRLSEYDGVTSGRDRGADLWDWLAFFTLLGMGIVPGLIWFYFCIYRDRFFVALTQCHGSPEEYLYRGLNDEHMEEMTRTIGEVAFPS